MVKIPQVNIKTVTTMAPEEIFNELFEKYGDISVPEYILGPEDLDRISQLLGWCTNSKSYLSSLEVYLDIATRNANHSGDKETHAVMVCRKNIVKTFKDNVSDVYAACSRQATIYFEQRKELEEEQRNNSVQYGGGQIGKRA